MPAGAASAPDTLLGMRIPDGLAVSVAVEMRDGAALRAVTCRQPRPANLVWDDFEVRRATVR